MIINGNCRGDGIQAGVYITAPGENERVEVLEQWQDYGHDPASNVRMAVMDFDLWSKSTLGEKGLYHAQINPHPDFDGMTPELWKHCADHLEKKLGLEGQPRVMTLHTKNGRTHAHVIWARTDLENNRLINISYSRLKQKEAGRELTEELYPHLEINRMPSKGKSYDRDEQQQHDRKSLSVEERREAVAEDWQQARDGETFIKRLEARGYILAQGDRRGFVLVDREGDVYNPVKDLTKTLGVKTKEFRERLGIDPANLPNVEEAKARQAEKRREADLGHYQDAEQWIEKQKHYHETEREGLKDKQKRERKEKAAEIKAFYDQNRPEAMRKAFLNLHEYDCNRNGYPEARLAAEKKASLEGRIKSFSRAPQNVAQDFEKIYRDPDEARKAYAEFFKEQGANKTARELDARPETFGKLRGSEFTETKVGKFLGTRFRPGRKSERQEAIEHARKASRSLDRKRQSIGKAKSEAEQCNRTVSLFMATERAERKALLADLAISAKGLSREEWKRLDDWQKFQLQAARDQVREFTPEDWKETNPHRKHPEGLSPIEQKHREEWRTLKKRQAQEIRKTRDRETEEAKGKTLKERKKEREKLVKTFQKEKEKGLERDRGRSPGED